MQLVFLHGVPLIAFSSPVTVLRRVSCSPVTVLRRIICSPFGIVPSGFCLWNLRLGVALLTPILVGAFSPVGLVAVILISVRLVPIIPSFTFLALTF